MTDLVFDIYEPPVTPGDPGTRLVRLTRNHLGPGTFYRAENSPGPGSGRIIVERDQSFVTAARFAVGNYVIVRDLDFSSDDDLNALGSFLLQTGSFNVIDEPGKGVLQFGGPGGAALLDDAIMGNEALSPFEGPYDIVDGYWRWGSDVYGGVFRRALLEANLQDPPGLPWLFYSVSGGVIVGDGVQWDDSADSNGDPWPSFVGEFSTQCGTTLYALAMELHGYGVEWAFDPVTFQFYAYNAGGYGDDLTGSIEFDGTNIAERLKRTIQGRLPLTHVLVRTTDHPEGGFIESASFSPGDPVRKGVYQTGDISGDPSASTVLQDRAQRLMDLRGLAEDGITFHTIKPVDGLHPGPHYANGPTSVGGDFWVGDIVSITSGSEDFDYVNAAKRIEAITFEMGPAADDDDPGWNVKVETGPRVGPGTTWNTPAPSALPLPILFCRDPEISAQRYYPTMTGADFDPAIDAAWDDDAAGSHTEMTATPNGSLAGTGSGITTSTGGDADGRNVAIYAGLIGPIDADFAAALAAGNVEFLSYWRVRARSGIGISESSQDMIGQEVIKVYNGSTHAARGTALAAHAAASTAGATKWRANTQHQNRPFPPEGQDGTLSAVAGTIAGDYVSVQLGKRDFTTVTGGAAMLPCNDEDTDLPEDVVSVADLNSWVQFTFATGTGGYPEDTVLQGEESNGDSPKASPCNHKHAHGLLAPGGSNYHGIAQLSNYVVHGSGAPTEDEDAGDDYRSGTFWIDDDTNDVYFLVDATEGAAIWLGPIGSASPPALDDLTDVVITTPADGDVLTYDSGSGDWVNEAASGGSSLTVEEEDGSPSESPVSKIEVPNGTLTVDSSGVVSLDYASSGHTHGGGGLAIPTLLQSTKGSADTPDDEFTGTSLNGKWTKVDGTETGIGNLLASSGAGLLEVGERSGWLAMQVGTTAGDSVELRQDYTLPDGSCIVAYVSMPLDWAGGTVANNEIWTGIGVNDNDAGIFSGTSGQTAMCLVDTDSGGYRIIGLSATSPTYIGTNKGTSHAIGMGYFLRIDRDGLNYHLFSSHDGFSWDYIGVKAMATAANNVWLWAWCNATMGQRMTVWVPWFRQGTALAFDPWPL